MCSLQTGESTMNQFFSPDSNFSKVMNRVADLIILNLLYLISCLPIFTIGAASTALYTICFRFDTEREGSVWKTYWHAFTSNFKQSTSMWIFLALFELMAVSNTLIFFRQDGIFCIFGLLFGLFSLIIPLAGAMLFPLLSQFENSWQASLKNALLLSLAKLPKAVLLAGLQLLPFMLYGFIPHLFLLASPLWFLIYFSGIHYYGSRILKKVYQAVFPAYSNDDQVQP